MKILYNDNLVYPTKTGGAIDIHKLIGKLPRPKGGWTLPNHKYTGPYNPLSEQLDENDEPRPGHEPYNQIDSIAMHHDICYRDNEEGQPGKHKCDQIMIDKLDELKPNNIRERIDRSFVRNTIAAKKFLGLGNG